MSGRVNAPTFGWPEVMPTRMVALYTGYDSSTITRARAAAEFAALGRHGRTFVFERSEVDRWMRAVEPIETVNMVPSTRTVTLRAPRLRSVPQDESTAKILQLGRGRS